jgi:DNA-binding transcriptional LysR family regulator
LSDGGRIYYERATSVLKAVTHAEAVASEQAKALRGKLKIACPTCLGEVLIPALLQRFRNLHPDLTIDLVLSDHPTDPLAQGAELTIGIGDTPSGNGREAEHVIWLERVLAASPAYLSTHGVPQAPSDLKQHAFIRVVGYFGDNMLPLKHDGNLQFHPIKSAWVVANWHPVPALLSSSAGIALVPVAVAEKELRSGQWVRVLPGYDVPDAAVWLMYSRAGQPTEKAKRAKAFLVHALASIGKPARAPTDATKGTIPTTKQAPRHGR